MTSTFAGPRISIKRLRAAITKVNNARKFGIGLPANPFKLPSEKRREIPMMDFLEMVGTFNIESKLVSAERATQLYALRSHLRGNLHVTHQYVQIKQPDGTCREECFKRTMDDQAVAIAHLIPEFQMTEGELKDDAEERLARGQRMLGGPDALRSDI